MTLFYIVDAYIPIVFFVRRSVQSHTLSYLQQCSPPTRYLPLLHPCHNFRSMDRFAYRICIFVRKIGHLHESNCRWTIRRFSIAYTSISRRRSQRVPNDHFSHCSQTRSYRSVLLLSRSILLSSMYAQRAISILLPLVETNRPPSVLHSSLAYNTNRPQNEATEYEKLHVTNKLDAFLGARSGRVSGAGKQVLPGPGRGGRGEHHARHLHQELLGRHSRYHSINAVS